MQKSSSKRRRRAALYARVSTTRQAERELSIPDQLRQMREHCAKNDIEVAEEFIEPGISGQDESRPQFQAMLSKACSDDHPYDFLLVHSFSRFARLQVVLLSCYEDLLKHGVRLQAITQSTDDSPEGMMMMSIIGAFDQYSSAQTSKHTHRAMCQCARDGYWPGSHAPDGYKKVPARQVGDKTRYLLEPDPERAEVIVKIFELALNGEGQGPMGVKAICKHLNARGIRTRKGGKWGIGTVHSILSSTTYIGEHYFNRTSPKLKAERPREEWISFPIEPLISTETFEAVSQNLKARAPKKTAPRLASSPMLLTGMIFCGDCGAAMTQMTGKGGLYTYYACANQRRTGADTCSGRNVPQGVVESAVCGVLADRVLATEHVEGLISECIEHNRSQSDNDARLRKAQKRLLDAEAGLKRLYEGVVAGVLDPAEQVLKEQLDGLKLRKSEAHAEVERFKSLKAAAFTPPSAANVAKFAGELRTLITEGKIPLRKAYIRSFVDQITIKSNQIVITGRKDVLASAAAKGAIIPSGGGVLTYVPEWCARQDSNL